VEIHISTHFQKLHGNHEVRKCQKPVGIQNIWKYRRTKQNHTFLGFCRVKNDKYNLTDKQLSELLLVSTVIRGVRVISEENDYETSTRSERQTSEETVQLTKNDQIRVKESTDSKSLLLRRTQSN